MQPRNAGMVKHAQEQRLLQRQPSPSVSPNTLTALHPVYQVPKVAPEVLLGMLLIPLDCKEEKEPVVGGEMGEQRLYRLEFKSNSYTLFQNPLSFSVNDPLVCNISSPIWRYFSRASKVHSIYLCISLNLGSDFELGHC